MPRGDRAARVRAAQGKHRAGASKRTAGAIGTGIVILLIVVMRAGTHLWAEQANKDAQNIVNTMDQKLSFAPLEGEVPEGLETESLEWRLETAPGSDDVEIVFNGDIRNVTDSDVRATIEVRVLDGKDKVLVKANAALPTIKAGQTKPYKTNKVKLSAKKRNRITKTYIVVDGEIK